MSLSRFLRDYLYIALGGNRKGAIRRYLNLFLTMLIGGLWHGANWTFVFWGGLHGLYLLINHAWRAIRPQAKAANKRSPWALVSWLGTFLSVALAWVFFRAGSMATALAIVRGMAGLNGVDLPNRLAGPLGFLAPLGVRFDVIRTIDPQGLLLMGGLVLVVLFVPDTTEWVAKARPTLQKITSPARWQWRPVPVWALVTAAIAGIAMFFMLSNVSEFLYFKF